MSDEILVSARNLAKCYWLYKRYRHRLMQFAFSGLLKRNYAEPFWALKDVSFDLKRGQALGVIGVNGSGKSTLLQILAGTLQPTTGELHMRGRITALLELGTGFHPEFTGRENVFLSGATIGIPEREMKKRFDEIVDFAGIGEFIDQPVKMYSSGMYVRLAFSIATSVDPEILVVDEALAVGDAGFVLKCMNRMQRLRENGAAIILVSHDIQTVRSFCDQALWLNRGIPQALGGTMEVTSKYVQYLWGAESQKQEPGSARKISTRRADNWINLTNAELVRWGTGEIRFESCEIHCEDGDGDYVFDHGRKLSIRARCRAMVDIPSERIGIGFAFRDLRGLDIITNTTLDEGQTIPPLQKGQVVEATFEVDNLLRAGDYALVLNVEDRSSSPPHYYDFIEDAVVFKVLSQKPIFSLVLPPIKQTLKIDNGD